MIFDYILNNRFYAPDNADAVDPSLPDSITNLVVEETPANPYADIIPKAPHNRLETFLNMIVGDTFRVPSGYVAADPIKPISEMEYWLNEIAAAKDGNPWRDTASKFVAKKIDISVSNGDELRHMTQYSLTIDTGLKEFPYAMFRMEGEANGCEIHTIDLNIRSASEITPLHFEVKNGDVLETRDAINNALMSLTPGDHLDEVFPGDMGLLFDEPINVLFIRHPLAIGQTIKIQVLMNFVTLNDHDFVPYDNEADELIFDTFDLKFVEVKEGHSV